MTEEMNFNIPVPKKPDGIQMTSGEVERHLFKKAETSQAAFEKAIWNLIVFYAQTSQIEKAIPNIQKLMALSDDPETKAQCLLILGQLMENTDQYEKAIHFYSEALSLEPIISNVWYLINNNLGYCLNQCCRYDEAIPYCESAIQISPDRHNAYKNLGVALEGLGNFSEAALHFIESIQRNAGDPRALGHLEELIVLHKEVLSDIPDLTDKIFQCRQAVHFAHQVKQDFIAKMNKKQKE